MWNNELRKIKSLQKSHELTPSLPGQKVQCCFGRLFVSEKLDTDLKRLHTLARFGTCLQSWHSTVSTLTALSFSNIWCLADSIFILSFKILYFLAVNYFIRKNSQHLHPMKKHWTHSLWLVQWWQSFSFAQKFISKTSKKLVSGDRWRTVISLLNCGHFKGSK